jgi:hypothetical protein
MPVAAAGLDPIGLTYSRGALVLVQLSYHRRRSQALTEYCSGVSWLVADKHALDGLFSIGWTISAGRLQVASHAWPRCPLHTQGHTACMGKIHIIPPIAALLCHPRSARHQSDACIALEQPWLAIVFDGKSDTRCIAKTQITPPIAALLFHPRSERHQRDACVALEQP